VGRKSCPNRLPGPGLYPVTDAALTRERGLFACVESALEGGAVMVQYRDKTAHGRRRLSEASRLAALCHGAGVPLIVNDDPALAAEAGAHGVHLGRDDGPVSRARALLGPEAIIGVSCYNELPRARAASADGADYVAFGRFFTSCTKPEAALATPALLRAARAELDLPLAAIGGITAANGAALVAAGARWLAVVHDLWSAADIAARAHALARCFA
jgi:thiamine-phosphate pyrophosphorylase